MSKNYLARSLGYYNNVRSIVMTNENSNSNFDIDPHIPPNTPKNYAVHERNLWREYGEGVMKSIQKEIEGMARLYDAVESDVDNETRQELQRAIDGQVEKLRDLEDEVVCIAPRLKENEQK